MCSGGALPSLPERSCLHTAGIRPWHTDFPPGLSRLFQLSPPKVLQLERCWYRLGTGWEEQAGVGDRLTEITCRAGTNAEAFRGEVEVGRRG